MDVLLDVSGRELWGSKLGLIIFQTFKKRAGEIGDHARNARGGITGGGGGGGEATGVEFLRGLDETERALFKAMHEGDKGVRAWLKGWSKQS